LREDYKPRDFVIPDQLFDRTKGRASTFFSDGIVAHVGFADPFCPHLSKIAYDTAKAIDIPVNKGGTYICIEGPQFSTRAESNAYRKMGFSIIGMTNLPEAKLAREAEMCYVTVALVTDYDVWKEDEEVSLEQVIANLNANSENAKKIHQNDPPAVTETIFLRLFPRVGYRHCHGQGHHPAGNPRKAGSADQEVYVIPEFLRKS
jgi:Purine nucleoside phosphorylase